MDARWLFVPFDWRRYVALAPRLCAFAIDGVEALDDIEGAVEILDECDADAVPEAISNALLTELCLVGEGALFAGGLAELLTWLRRQPGGSELSDLLAIMISASPGVEPWFAAEQGIVGVLTIEETSELARQTLEFRRGFNAPIRPRGLAALSGHFRTTEPAIERLRELFDVIDEAAAEMHGLAAVRVE